MNRRDFLKTVTTAIAAFHATNALVPLQVARSLALENAGENLAKQLYSHSWDLSVINNWQEITDENGLCRAQIALSPTLQLLHHYRTESFPAKANRGRIIGNDELVAAADLTPELAKAVNSLGPVRWFVSEPMVTKHLGKTVILEITQAYIGRPETMEIE